MTDSLYEGFKNEPAPVGIDPADGLPRPVVSQAWQDAQAPELDPSRFVCMADCSEFVIRGSWGDPLIRIPPSAVERAPNGRWRVSVEKLVPHAGPQINAQREEVTKRRRREGVKGEPELTDAALCAQAFLAKAGYVAVEPIRPQCTHYARQLVPFPEEKTRTLALRLCTARRTDEGEFLDIGNAQVLACELRSPVYGNEAGQIDAFDERTIAEQQKTKANAVADDFDVDAALGAQQTTTKGN